MSETRYWYNWEYACKCTIPITESTKDTNVEIYDRYNDSMLNISEMTAKELIDLTWEIWGTWREITEEEYNKIINS